MSMKFGDRIVAPSRGTAAQAIAFATSNGAARLGEVAAYIREVYRLAPLVGIDPAIVIAQSVHETTLNGRPWASDWWFHRLNPAGIGITGNPADDEASKTWANGIDAARAQIGHLLVYIGAWDWLRDNGVAEEKLGIAVPFSMYDPRFSAVVNGQLAGTVRTIADLTGKWAVDPGYARGIVEKASAIFPGLPDQEGQSVPAFATTVPGLPGGPLLTDYPVKLNVLPATMTRNRPGIPAQTPRRSVQHGNGNPDSTAASEAQYLRNGAEGRQASYHSTCDDRECWVMIPANEVTWQAADGAGPGNMNGFSCEMIEDADVWADPARRDRIVAVTADFMGRCAARLKILKPEQHWDFNYNSPPSERHDCPNKLRHVTMPDGRVAWSHYTDRWHEARQDELARMAGTPTTTTTAPPPPPPPLVKRTPIPMPADARPGTLFWVGTRLYQVVTPERVKLARSARQYAAPDGKSVASHTPLARGKTVTMPYVVAGSDGLLYRASKSGTHIRAENFLPRRTTAEGG